MPGTEQCGCPGWAVGEVWGQRGLGVPAVHLCVPVSPSVRWGRHRSLPTQSWTQGGPWKGPDSGDGAAPAHREHSPVPLTHLPSPLPGAGSVSLTAQGQPAGELRGSGGWEAPLSPPRLDTGGLPWTSCGPGCSSSASHGNLSALPSVGLGHCRWAAGRAWETCLSLLPSPLSPRALKARRG